MPLTEQQRIELVEKDGMNLGDLHADEQTYKICLAAVRKNGMALQWVAKQTPLIIFEAIGRTPNAIRHAEVSIVTDALSNFIEDAVAHEYYGYPNEMDDYSTGNKK